MMKIFSICLLLLVTSGAPGAIIYRTTDYRFGSATGGPFGNSSAQIDVNQDGFDDWSVLTTVTSQNVWIFLDSPDSTRFVFRPRLVISGTEPGPLEEMTHISLSLENPELQFLAASEASRRSLVFTSNNDGNISDPAPFNNRFAYLGFEFEIAGERHFGYAGIEGIENSGAIISSLAWESEPGVGIRAGAIPEPSNFVLLVVGILGLLAQRWRVAWI
jgi:hypothetical protein